MKTFVLQRHEDSTGVSGEGRVAAGIITPQGASVMKWFNEDNPRLNTDNDGISIKPAPDGKSATEQIHGHGGNTELVYTDDVDDSIVDELYEVLLEVTGELHGIR